jgi:hypothetical protein
MTLCIETFSTKIRENDAKLAKNRQCTGKARYVSAFLRAALQFALWSLEM